jgi:AcrR family transcriptional regulator
MVRSAVNLLARDGLQATGMRDIADHAQAPRGSIQHHFPGGKDQLTLEALAWIGCVVRAELDDASTDVLETGDRGPLPNAVPGGNGGSTRSLLVLEKFVAMWRDGMIQTHVATGCSVAAVVQDSNKPELLDQAARVFASWREPFHRALLADGVAAEQASGVATTVIAALEGAVILSRARRDLEPLEQTAAVLHYLLLTVTNPSQDTVRGSVRQERTDRDDRACSTSV